MNSQFVSFKNVEITDGFWKEKQYLNKNVTVHAVKDRFEDTGRFEAFRCNRKEGMDKKPHFFWDSDIAKWLEAAAYIIQKEPSPLLEKKVDEVVDLIEKNQCEDGYFNIYYTVVEPGNRFTNRDRHELYCAGHLTEAAVAYYDATGKDKFLKCMCKYIDCIEKAFKTDKTAAFKTPGHEEIELALVKLYRCTGEKRYLELSKYFIDKRGTEKEELGNDWTTARYYQSHKPCREQFTAEGHSVRACYLYTGMADIAREYSDSELLNACKKIFDDIYNKKMYITAGVGQSHHGEAFTVAYDLRNGQAYTETCASIALAMFCLRMQNLELDSRYGDVIERAIYNGILSGLSLDGKSFFYENPLEIDLEFHNRNVSLPKEKERFPITQRVEVFSCSCCPPNITRFIASIGDYIYAYGDKTVFVHQFVSSNADINGIKVKQFSGFPYDGNVNIEIINTNAKFIAIRIPGYSKEHFTVLNNGKKAEYEVKNGYAFIELFDKNEIKICFDLSPKCVFANPGVHEDAGRCAIVAGPLVYCAESCDNGKNLLSFGIPEKFCYEYVKNEELGTTDIITDVLKTDFENCDMLYSFTRKTENAKLHLIPYFAFANRGECDMEVWLTAK